MPTSTSWLGRGGLLTSTLLLLTGCWSAPPEQKPVTVARGDLVDHLVESGRLIPSDPVMVTAPFSARLQWVIDDDTWVEAGDRLAALSDESEQKRVADLRGQLLAARQNLVVSRLRREQTAATARASTVQAAETLRLERIRHRIATTPASGGLDLITLDEQLRPLAEATASVERAWRASDTARRARMLAAAEALDRWQGHRDETLRAFTRVEELEALAGATGPDAAQAALDLVQARSDLVALEQRGAGLAEAVAATRSALAVAAAPAEADEARLDACRAKEEELRIRIEIEKRGLPLARLRLDARIQEMAAASTAREATEATIAQAAGAIPLAELETARRRAADAEAMLAITRDRISALEGPLPPEQQAEADANLAKAEAKAARAADDERRALATADADLAVQEARVTKLEAQIENRGRAFPSVVESGVRFLERELKLLEPGDADGRAALEKRLATERVRLAEMQARPPSVVVSPLAGVARVHTNGSRPLQAGDQAWEEDVLVSIHPPGRLRVQIRLNQADVGKVRAGAPVEVTIPATAALIQGRIDWVAAVAQDKHAAPDAAAKGFADVPEFPAEISLATTDPAWRQGMAVLVRIPVAEVKGVLHLPRRAVVHEGAQWKVLTPDGWRTLRGRAFADDAFVVEDGLAEGDAVLIPPARGDE